MCGSIHSGNDTVEAMNGINGVGLILRVLHRRDDVDVVVSSV